MEVEIEAALISAIIAIFGWIINFFTTKYLNKSYFNFHFFSENGLGYLEIKVHGNFKIKINKFEVLGYGTKRLRGKMKIGEIKELAGVVLYPDNSIKFCLGDIDYDANNIIIEVKKSFFSNKFIIPFDSEYEKIENFEDKIVKGAIVRIANYLTGDNVNTLSNLTGFKELRTSLYKDLKELNIK